MHPSRGPKPLNHPAHRYAYDDVDKDDNDKYDLDDDVFNPKGKTNGFLIVFIDLGWSTVKDDKLEKKNGCPESTFQILEFLCSSSGRWLACYLVS